MRRVRRRHLARGQRHPLLRALRPGRAPGLLRPRPDPRRCAPLRRRPPHSGHAPQPACAAPARMRPQQQHESAHAFAARAPTRVGRRGAACAVGPRGTPDLGPRGTPDLLQAPVETHYCHVRRAPCTRTAVLPAPTPPPCHSRALRTVRRAGEWLCCPCAEHEASLRAAGKPQSEIRPARWELAGKSQDETPALEGGSTSASCALCPVKRGAFKRTADGKAWVHLVRGLCQLKGLGGDVHLMREEGEEDGRGGWAARPGCTWCVGFAS